MDPQLGVTVFSGEEDTVMHVPEGPSRQDDST